VTAVLELSSDISSAEHILDNPGLTENFRDSSLFNFMALHSSQGSYNKTPLFYRILQIQESRVLFPGTTKE
jgi:hypothetical protein